MVSFSCEGCNETMVKKKVVQHINRCGAPVTCIDCSKTFPGQSFKDHNQCITEDQKYQGKLYKPKPAKGANNDKPKPKPEPKLEETKKETKENKKQKDAETKKEPTPIRVTKNQPLKKVLKKLRKEHKLDKKQILNKIAVTKDGQLVLQ